MALPSKTFQQFVSDIVAGWAAALGFQPTLQQGDSLFALMETVAAQLVFIQALIQIVNKLSRAQTSTGADLDTWMAQFGFTRLPATYATGTVTFSSFNPAASQVIIPVGTTVQTQGGAIQFKVVADTTQSAWNATLNGYVLAVGQSVLNATVQAVVAGTGSNVTAGQISQIAAPISGIDQVTNGGAISNALNAESDSAFLSRFVGFINSLSKATYGAIVSAIQGVQQGISFNLIENVNVADVFTLGEFVAVIDNGTGTPPVALVNAVQTAINKVRGFTIMAQAIAVNPVSLTISLAIRVNTSGGYVQSTVNNLVAQAIVTAVNANPIGTTGYISAIETAALSVAGVISVQPGQTLINGFNTDLAVTPIQATRTSINLISVTNY